MDTKKATGLKSDQVESATHTLRAYKHKFRYDIINRLLDNGSMSSEEIASYLDLSEPYIAEQLAILLENDLIQAEQSPSGVYFSANELRLKKIREGLSSFFGQEED